MNDAARQALASWSMPPYFTAALIIAALIYLRGFRPMHARMPARFPHWRCAAFLGGLFAMLIAIASPMAAFDDLLLQVHMAQHMLLMFAAPPLLWLGAPQIPMLRGLPRVIVRRILAPLLKSRTVGAIARIMAHPAACWLALAAATWIWHAPGPYQLALRSERWHELEHWCFSAAAALFWWPVVQPWPSRGRWPRWSMVPYLLLADLQNTVLSALLTFSDRVIYPYYESVPRVAGVSALNDQIAAGVIMWVPGSLFFLVPAVMIIFNLLAVRNAVDPAGINSNPAAQWRPAAPCLAASKGKGAGS